LVQKEKRYIPLVVLYSCFFLYSLFPSQVYSAVEKDIDAILAAAEAVFQHMQKGDYPSLWAGLTAETQRRIIRNVQKEVGNTGPEESETLIRRDFEKGGVRARSYWDAYLAQFNPKMVLEESTWKMGGVNKDRADIILRYKKAHNDAILQMYREAGIWKVGLEETFAPRRQ